MSGWGHGVRANVPRRTTALKRAVGRAGLLAVALLLFSAATALAGGLTLVSIPGPGGTVPFKSPGGFGPTFVASPPGDTHRVFVGTQDGYIYVIDNGVLQPTPFLDLRSQVSTYNEDGMWSLAFDPGYATNRRFYVSYSDNSNADPSNLNLENYHFDEFQTSATNPDLADPATQTQILEVPTTGCTAMTSPHYGGQLQFGPDGDLWVAIGDGGDGCNDDYNSLYLNNLHGKLLRIIPEPTQAPNADGCRCDIPADNPLVGQSGVDPEIWAYGLRNPYRFSFDPTNGNVVIGDVGNSTQEEIDDVPSTLASGAPPPFFGWPCIEGTYVTPTINPCPVTQTPTSPVLTYTHLIDPITMQVDCTAIIGGYVLEDASLGGDYDGRYLYGYFCAGDPPGNGELLTTNLNTDLTAQLDGVNPANAVTRDEGIGVGFGLSSFGQDACGHTYAMNVTAGGLWRIEGSTPGACGEFTPPQTTLVSPPSGIVKQASETIAFTSNIVGSTFACSLDGAPAQACTSPTSYSGLADGPHTVSVTATNQAGETGSAATASWIVDTGPPHTTITSSPSTPDYESTATIAFTASESDVTFACSLDGAPAQACTSPTTYSGLADGSHTVWVTATDAAGNVEAPPAVASWIVVPPPPRLRAVFFQAARAVVVGTDGRLRVRLHAVAENARGTLTVRRDGKVLVRATRFRASSGKPITVVLVLPAAVRRLLSRHGGLRVRIVVSLVGSDGQVSRDSVTVQTRMPPTTARKHGLRLRAPFDHAPSGLAVPVGVRPGLLEAPVGALWKPAAVR